MQINKKYGEKITPGMFGLFFEDISYGADGGLYAEMIENRSFEAKEAHGTPGNFYAIDDYGYAWRPVYRRGEKPPVMQYVTGTPLSTVNPHYLRFTAKDAGQGFANKAYDGIYLEKGASYKVSFYARCVRYEGRQFKIEIKKGDEVYAAASVKAVAPVPYLPFSDLEAEFLPPIDALAARLRAIRALDQTDMCREHEWCRYETVLTAVETITGADFVISLDREGIVEFDLISMIPEDAVAGIFRKDLFQALQEIHPGFIRFPGGCIVEGISLENRYQWKHTIGALKDRKYIPNLWAFDDDRSKTDPDVMRPTAAHYGQSYGIGFYEYFLLCELLGARPLPVVGMGIACQFRTTELVPVDSPAFQDYIQDAIDLIEFANGPETSAWGSVRAKMGHPEPFHLEMLAVGNEQWETEQVAHYERHRQFEAAIHAVYPEIKLVGTAGPIIDLPTFEEAWTFYRQGEAEKEGFCYAVDEHYYVPLTWMYDHVDFYDDYPRDVAVFAGEYAAHTELRENNMESALAEAAFLTGVEKNAGVVHLASYAPLFNRIGHSQWQPDLIWFDDRNVYLTPNYYVQKLYANHLGDHTLDLGDQIEALRDVGIYVSASAKEAQGDDPGEIILKIVNAGSVAYELPLTDESGCDLQTEARVWILEQTGEGSVEMPDPSHVREMTMQIQGSIMLAPKTFTVIRY